ncbi:unnamed protein product [Ambrosiozyma monospora]|uniref:Unnamed protein product n=1 Tax=Ambrosiozyma monospora TaxID=43982 RepID=A0A9W6Z156_AMBMO|nr:unnamed protein product [Ambrosiozyma monospora]
MLSPLQCQFISNPSTTTTILVFFKVREFYLGLLEEPVAFVAHQTSLGCLARFKPRELILASVFFSPDFNDVWTYYAEMSDAQLSQFNFTPATHEL